MKRIGLFLIFSVVFLSFTSCDDEENDLRKINVNKEVLNIMEEYYLWYNLMPSVNPNNYSSPIELMDALRVNPPDKWSYVTSRTELEAYYNQAAYVGFGFGSGFNANGDLIVSFVYKNSPLATKGIDRGWQILLIDGKVPTIDNYSSLIGANEIGISKTFAFKSPSGNTLEYTFTKEQITMNTVIMDTVYTFGATKVGYVVLESFIEKTTDELNTTFAKFKSKGINELIVDLRYNGGGQVSVSNFLANLIGGSIAYGKVYAKSSHNSKKQSLNKYYLFDTESNSIPLSKVVFITTKGTASASELVINGLKPFMDVVLVGDRTHGKPVGMYTFTFTDPSIDWAIVPICFAMLNANDEGDYFEGIPANIYEQDDVSLPFGDTNEASLNAALANLGLTTKTIKKQIVPFKSIVGKGIKAEIGAW